MANPYEQLKGIPIDYLVSAPLMAAARANLSLAQNMVEFIYQVGYGIAPGSSTAPTAQTPTLVLTFNLTRPYTDPNSGSVSTQTIQVQVPLIGIVTIPALLVDNVSINFTATVDQASSTTASVSADVSAKYGIGAFALSGSVSTNKTQTSSSSAQGTYTFAVTATQQQATQGMDQMMTVFSSTIQPIPTSSSSSSGSSSASH